MARLWFAMAGSSQRMRRRWRARSAPPAAASRRSDQAACRRRRWLAVEKDGLAANQSANGAASDRLALVRAEWMAVKEILIADDALVGKVHQPKVGVVCGGDVAFAFQAEAARDVGRRHRGHIC